MTYVFLLDTAFALFYNSPPRLVIAELQMDITCPEECFQALSADECLRHFAEWTTAKACQEKLSFCAAFRKICQQNMPLDLEDMFCHMSTLNMFSIVTGLWAHFWRT